MAPYFLVSFEPKINILKCKNVFIIDGLNCLDFKVSSYTQLIF